MVVLIQPFLIFFINFIYYFIEIYPKTCIFSESKSKKNCKNIGDSSRKV